MADSGRLGYEILAMDAACKKMTPYPRQDCPECAWPLEDTPDKIRHCRFCGWTDQIGIRRDVPRP